MLFCLPRMFLTHIVAWLVALLPSSLSFQLTLIIEYGHPMERNNDVPLPALLDYFIFLPKTYHLTQYIISLCICLIVGIVWGGRVCLPCQLMPRIISIYWWNDCNNFVNSVDKFFPPTFLWKAHDVFSYTNKFWRFILCASHSSRCWGSHGDQDIFYSRSQCSSFSSLLHLILLPLPLLPPSHSGSWHLVCSPVLLLISTAHVSLFSSRDDEIPSLAPYRWLLKIPNLIWCYPKTCNTNSLIK